MDDLVSKGIIANCLNQMMEYFNWLEQEAEEQRRAERQERAKRFLPVDDNETDTDDGREA